MKQKVPNIRFEGYIDDWEQRKLGDVSKITMGQSPSSKNYTTDPNDHILVQGNADMVDGLVTPRVWTTEVTKTADIDDIIFSVRAPVGDTGKTSFPVVIGRGVASIKGNDFVYYDLIKKKSDKYWDRVSTGSTFESINSFELKTSLINIPSEKEQLSIGNLMNNIDKTITLHQRKLDLYIELKKTMLTLLFPNGNSTNPSVRFSGFTDDWEQRKLNLIADRFDNLRIPVTESNRILGTTPYYGANGILDYVDGFTHDGEYVLIAEDGANDINDYPVHYVNGKVWVNNHAHVIQAKEGISDNRFLQYSFKTFNIEPYLVGGSRAKLNANIMMDLIINTPEIEEQIQIGKFFKDLDNLITLHQRKLDLLKQQKQYFLKMLFV